MLIIACGLLLPVLLLNKQKMELERQREYVTYAQVQPLYFGKGEHFSHREPEKEEMTLTEADFIARKKLQEYFAMEILQHATGLAAEYGRCAIGNGWKSMETSLWSRSGRLAGGAVGFHPGNNLSGWLFGTTE